VSVERHIVHLNTNADWGGGEDQVLNLVVALRGQGWACTLLAHPRGRLLPEALARGVRAEPVPLCFPVGRLARRLYAQRVDLLHVHDSRGVGWGGRLASRLGVPMVLTRRVASPLRRNSFSRRKYSPRRLAAVIAISETVRDVFAAGGYPAERIHLAPSGLDLEALGRVAPDPAFRAALGGGPVLGGIGKLSVKKNWAFMLRVAARLAGEAPGLRWALAGDGPERRELERMRRELEIEDRVQFLGFRRDALRLLKSVDALFFPSVREGASVTVRQAMALGVPVIAVDAPGTAESLGGHGWMVRDGDVEGAARAVLDVLRHPEAAQAAARAAKASAEQRFGFALTVDGTIRVYEAVLQQARGGEAPGRGEA